LEGGDGAEDVGVVGGEGVGGFLAAALGGGGCWRGIDVVGDLGETVFGVGCRRGIFFVWVAHFGDMKTDNW